MIIKNGSPECQNANLTSRYGQYLDNKFHENDDYEEKPYLIRINFRADKISRKFAQRRPYARNFIRELGAERSCAKINPREKFQNEKCSCSSLFLG